MSTKPKSQIQSKKISDIFIKNPESIITIYDENKNLLSFQKASGKTWTEIIYKDESVWLDEKHFRNWKTNHKDIELTGRKETIIVLSKPQKFEIDLENKRIKEKIKKERERANIKTRIYDLLNMVGLGTSGRGLSPQNIREMLCYSYEDIRHYLDELVSENKIEGTGQTRMLKFCIIEVREQAIINLKKELLEEKIRKDNLLARIREGILAEELQKENITKESETK